MKKIGPYSIEKLLGHGGSAAVYLGRKLPADEAVAIKLLHMFTPEEQAQKSFQREVEVIQRLYHPGIIRVLEIGFSDQVPYFTMPYASGGSLHTRHPQGERVPVDVVQVYLAQIASALLYAHEHKVVHQDIKPENILMTQDGQLLLSDFGVAQIIQTSRQMSTQEPVGTLSYMAPEQFQGKPCPASDQYALAITIYTWLCGELPFKGYRHEHLLQQHLFEAPSSLRDKNPAISVEIEKVVLRALAKEPTGRFPDIMAFARAFSNALSVTPTLTIPYEDQPTTIIDNARRNPAPRKRMSATEVTGALRRAQTFQNQGRFDDAIDLCEQILESGFDRPDARYFLGWLYQEQRRWDDAIQQFQLLLNDPDYALSCYYALGQCYRARGDLRTATVHFDEAVDRVNLDALTAEESEQLIQLCREAAEAHRLLGEQEQALTIYNALLSFLRSRGWSTSVTQVESMLLQALNNLPPSKPAQHAAPQSSTPEAGSSVDELPDWLSGILSDSQKHIALQADHPIKELPEWLTEVYLQVDRGKEPGRIYKIRPGSFQIGRSKDSTLFLEDIAVSRLHASIISDTNGNYTIKDEGSANGVKVNGSLIAKGSLCALQNGDKIQIGQTVFVFRQLVQ